MPANCCSWRPKPHVLGWFWESTSRSGCRSAVWSLKKYLDSRVPNQIFWYKIFWYKQISGNPIDHSGSTYPHAPEERGKSVDGLGEFRLCCHAYAGSLDFQLDRNYGAP